MINALVTGANGFVGKHLIEELKINGFNPIQIIGPDKGVNKNVLSIDLINGDDVKKVDFNGISYVVHLAGLAAVGPSFNQPMEYIKTNMGIEINLFEEALKQKAFPKFLIISSGSIYDPGSNMPLTEESPIRPSSPYSVSKLGQENIAKYYSTRGFECVIARPFNHIGPGQGPGFIVPDLAKQIIETRGDEIKVGNLDVRRDYTDVRDIVRAYRLLLESGVSGETYNICSGKSMSGNEILEGLMTAAGIRLKAVLDKTKLRPTEATDIYGSHEKITKDTGWKPEIEINQTLKDVLRSI